MVKQFLKRTPDIPAQLKGAYPHKEYAEQGYTSTKTHTVNGNDGKQHSKVNTYWTQKGRLFIYALLKSEGILPIMEQEQIA